MLAEIKINNMSEGYGEKYIVIRYADGGLWYYGRYSTEERAEEVAREVDGFVVEDVSTK